MRDFKPSSKFSWKWATLFAIVLGLAWGVIHFFNARSASNAALQAQQEAQRKPPVMAVAASEIATAQTLELQQVLAIAGSIKATDSAFVKARVAGELQGLSVREGDSVHAGQVLAKIDSTEYMARLHQAQQQAESAKAQVDIAQRTLDNNQALVKQGFISQTALESSLSNLASAQANYRAAQAGADVARKGLDDVVLRAPISGQISQRLAQSGERVGIDAKVVEIVDLSHLELEASLNATDSLAVHVGQVAELTVEGTGNTVQAKVVRVNPSASAGSRAVLAYLALSPNSGLRQGLFAQGTLALGTSRSLAVPLDCVRTDKPRPYVQTISNNQIQHQSVTMGALGQYHGVTMVVVSGIAENTPVLRGSVGVLAQGTAVQSTAVQRAAGTP